MKYWIYGDPETKAEVLDVTTPQAELRGLYSCCDYEMRVSAYNMMGEGVNTEVIPCKTLEDRTWLRLPSAHIPITVLIAIVITGEDPPVFTPKGCGVVNNPTCVCFLLSLSAGRARPASLQRHQSHRHAGQLGGASGDQR